MKTQGARKGLLELAASFDGKADEVNAVIRQMQSPPIKPCSSAPHIAPRLNAFWRIAPALRITARLFRPFRLPQKAHWQADNIFREDRGWWLQQQIRLSTPVAAVTARADLTSRRATSGGSLF
jgi:hypothetical protein